PVPEQPLQQQPEQHEGAAAGPDAAALPGQLPAEPVAAAEGQAAAGAAAAAAAAPPPPQPHPLPAGAAVDDVAAAANDDFPGAAAAAAADAAAAAAGGGGGGVAAEDEVQQDNRVRLLSRSVRWLWSVAQLGTDMASLAQPLHQQPSGGPGAGRPHACRLFRAQPELVRHAEAVVTATLGYGGSRSSGGGASAGGSSSSGKEGSAPLELQQQPERPQQGEMHVHDRLQRRLDALVIEPPGSCEAWRASLAGLMATCTAAAVRHRAVEVVAAMSDVRARLATAVTVAAVFAQQRQLGLAAEVLLAAYGSAPPPLGGGEGDGATRADTVAAAAAVRHPSDGAGTGEEAGAAASGGGDSDGDAMQVDGNSAPAPPLGSPSAPPRPPVAPAAPAAAPPHAPLLFSLTISGHSALLWACAHLDHLARIANQTARAAHPSPSSSSSSSSSAHSAAALAAAAEECRLLVPLVQALPEPFLERCATAVPSALSPTDLARQLLMSSLGRPQVLVGAGDAALALRHLVYYSRLQLRSPSQEPPLERELSQVALLLTSLVRLLDERQQLEQQAGQ
ncbi:hypothetical protein Agub_g8490, partial [Astrephomene gubernaculifera]